MLALVHVTFSVCRAINKEKKIKKTWVCFGNMFLKLEKTQTKKILDKGISPLQVMVWLKGVIDPCPVELMYFFRAQLNCITQLRMKFKLLMKTKMLKNDFLLSNSQIL